jgi:putative SOS response-associated peptidase YedK
VYIKLKNGLPFAFAGLWDLWHAQDGSEIRSCTIITCEPNQLMKPIHNRMPVILAPQAYRDWLSPKETQPAQLSQYLTAYPSNEMIAYPVSKIVNNPAYDQPACIQPA